MENLKPTSQNEVKTKLNWERIIGIVLLIPPILSVLLFLIELLLKETGSIPELDNLSSNWTGSYGYNEGGGGFSSTIVIYFGLMAIAGAYLLKGSFDDEKEGSANQK
ncbi:MAG: hypothetical protein ACK5MK_14885 [Dysgonomonas sp.]